LPQSALSVSLRIAATTAAPSTRCKWASRQRAQEPIFAREQLAAKFAQVGGGGVAEARAGDHLQDGILVIRYSA